MKKKNEKRIRKKIKEFTDEYLNFLDKDKSLNEEELGKLEIRLVLFGAESKKGKVRVKGTMKPSFPFSAHWDFYNYSEAMEIVKSAFKTLEKVERHVVKKAKEEGVIKEEKPKPRTGVT